jgi:hypothetical protein
MISAFKRIRSEFGPVNVLVYNAGARRVNGQSLIDTAEEFEMSPRSTSSARFGPAGLSCLIFWLPAKALSSSPARLLLCGSCLALRLSRRGNSGCARCAKSSHASIRARAPMPSISLLTGVLMAAGLVLHNRTVRLRMVSEDISATFVCQIHHVASERAVSRYQHLGRASFCRWSYQRPGIPVGMPTPVRCATNRSAPNFEVAPLETGRAVCLLTARHLRFDSAYSASLNTAALSA